MTYINQDKRRPIWLMADGHAFRPELVEFHPMPPPYVEFSFVYDKDFHQCLVSHFKDGLQFFVHGDPDREPSEPVRCRIHSLNAPLIETPPMVGKFASFGPIVVVIEALADLN